MSEQEKATKVRGYVYTAVFSILSAIIVSSIIGSFNKVAGSASKSDMESVKTETKEYTDMQIKNLNDRLYKCEVNMTNMATKDDIETLKTMMKNQDEYNKSIFEMLKEMSRRSR